MKTYWHPAGGRSGGRKTPPSEDEAVGFPPSVFVWQLCVCEFRWNFEADGGTLRVNSLDLILLLMF